MSKNLTLKISETVAKMAVKSHSFAPVVPGCRFFLHQPKAPDNFKEIMAKKTGK